jgi:nucleotide-binding universal stress UspA family protein
MDKVDYKTIMVPVDFSIASGRAIRQAALIAQKTAGELILLHVRTGKTLPNALQAPDDQAVPAGDSENVRQVLKALAADHTKIYGIRVRTVIMTGKLFSAIVKAADKYGAGLIVMGTRGSESVSSIFAGSNSSRMVGKTAIPVLTVRSGVNINGFGKILLPLDLSPHSRQKVKTALHLALRFNSSVHVLGLLPKSAKDQSYRMETYVGQVRKLARDYGVTCSGTIVYTDSPVSKTLAQARRLKTELIVTMTDENPANHFFRSDAFDKELVEESPVPVLSIQPEAGEESFGFPSIAGVW